MDEHATSFTPLCHDFMATGRNPTRTANTCFDLARNVSGTGPTPRRIEPAGLETEGFMTRHYSCVNDPEFQAVQQRAFDKLEVGRNSVNELLRGTAWGAYVKGEFLWHDRETYQLDASFNEEEKGAERHFVRADEVFLAHPTTVSILKDVAARLLPGVDSAEVLIQGQLSLIRMAPTLDKPALPSPIQPHQDEVDGAIVLLNRTGDLTGGISRIYGLDGRPRYELTLAQGDALFVKDDAVLHQVSPVVLEPSADWKPGDAAHRDVLLIRFQVVGR